MRLSKRSRRLLVAAATMPLLTSGLTLATATSASAELMCNENVAWHDAGGGSGYGVVNPTPIRFGPMSSCLAAANVSPSVHLAYDCYVINANNISWTHVHRYGQPDVNNGWVMDANLDDFGSNYHC